MEAIRITAKVHEIRKMRDAGPMRYLIVLETLDGDRLATWTRTDLRNFAEWQPIIQAGVGTRVGNLKLRDPKTIDADSRPEILEQGLDKVEK